MNSLSANHKKALKLLTSIEQQHLLNRWEGLTSYEQQKLLDAVFSLDLALFKRQQADLNTTQISKLSFSPFDKLHQSGNWQDGEHGRHLMGAGKCSCVVLAGGQGSRLRLMGPKGCFPISLIKQKSLFQLIAEKIKAASIQVGYDLKVAIMTAPTTHQQTVTFFEDHLFFGLKEKQISFFQQAVWPLLDFTGNLFLSSPYEIATGPNGNGCVFHCLSSAPFWKEWKKEGVELVNVIPVDNPLALPFDPELFGFHIREMCDVSLKVTPRHSPEEKVGILGQVDGRPHVIEYTEHGGYEGKPDEQIMANLGLFCFSSDFIDKAKTIEMPLHRAKKTVCYLTDQGFTELAKAPNAWKFEEFIFDVIPYSVECQGLADSRAACFAPLKNLEGADSIAEVQSALQTFERELYARITHTTPPHDRAFELAAEFYYPTEGLFARFRNLPLPKSQYIEDT